MAGKSLPSLRVPQYCDAVWPSHSHTVTTGGLLNFFRDFYHMTVKRPYQRKPRFSYIRMLINPAAMTSSQSMTRLLIICSAYSVQREFLQALLSLRKRRCIQDWPTGIWSPVHDLMDCISIVYQIMLHRLQLFAETRLLLLQDLVQWSIISSRLYLTKSCAEISRPGSSLPEQVSISVPFR